MSKPSMTDRVAGARDAARRAVERAVREAHDARRERGIGLDDARDVGRARPRVRDDAQHLLRGRGLGRERQELLRVATHRVIVGGPSGPTQGRSYRSVPNAPSSVDDRAFARRMAHEADAPALARELAEPAADLDVEAGPQLAAHLGVVDAVGQPHRRELREPALLARTAGSRARAARPAAAAPTWRWRACDGVEPFVEQHAEARVQRVEHRDRRGVVVAARGADVVGDAAPRSRYHDCGGLRAAADRARPRASRSSPATRPGGTPRHFCVPEYTASMPHPSTSTGMPPSDVTVSTSSSVSVCCSAASGAISFSTPVDVSACTTASSARLRVARAARRAAAADRSRGPTAASTRTTSAPHRRATSHMRSPNTPLTPMIAVSPGSSRLTKHASMPAEPVPLIGSVSAFVGAEHGAQAVGDLVEHDEEVGIEVPEHRALERFHHLGIRIRRPGPEQQSIGMQHAGRTERDRTYLRTSPANARIDGRRTRLASSAQAGEAVPAAAEARAARRRRRGLSPTTRPRASCAAARATRVTSSSGSSTSRVLRDVLHGRRGGERGRGRVRASGACGAASARS